MLEEISLNLVSVCDSIITDSEAKKNSSVKQYNRNGKKYRQTADGNFRRVQGESKYLVVGRDYGEFGKNYSICSSYYILKAQGSVLQDYRDLCLSIIFTSREIELNKWYEADTKICHIDECHYDPAEVEEEAIEYISNISNEDRVAYVKMGCSILAATKINFYQTDHHVAAPQLEGHVLRSLVSNVCAEFPETQQDGSVSVSPSQTPEDSCLRSPEVYNALRAFCHWCSIRGVLHCLNAPGLGIDEQLKFRFRTFPQLDSWILQSLTERYPAGTSKYGLAKKALIAISESVFGKLVAFPADLDAKELFLTCQQIEEDPIRFHVRAASLALSANSPLEASGMCSNIAKYLEFISILFHAGSYELGDRLGNSSKLLKYARVKNKPLFKQVQHMSNRMKGMERKKRVDDEEMVRRLGGEVENSVYSVVTKYNRPLSE